MAAPSHTSLRGLQTKYFFYRDPWFNGPEGSYTKDEDVVADAGESEEVDSYVTNCFAGAGWSYNEDPGVTDELLCMTYNPITDQFAIKEGSYVL